MAELASMKLGRELGSGGQGTVYITRFHGRLLAAKIYHKSVLPTLDTSILPQAVGLLRQLHPDDVGWIIQRFAWPVEPLTEGGSIVGFLMPLIPKQAFRSMTTVAGSKVTTLTASALMAPRSVVQQRLGLSMDTASQLSLLGGVSESLTKLHASGVVVGDLSGSNLLAVVGSLGLEPFFIDCDSFIFNQRSISPPLTTPGWEVPERAVNTPSSDVFKVGLLACRLADGSTNAHSAHVVHSSIRAWVERALSDTPNARPTMKELRDTLADVRTSPVAHVDSTSTHTGAPATSPYVQQFPQGNEPQSPHAQQFTPQACGQQYQPTPPKKFSTPVQVVIGFAIAAVILLIWMMILGGFDSDGDDGFEELWQRVCTAQQARIPNGDGGIMPVEIPPHTLKLAKERADSARRKGDDRSRENFVLAVNELMFATLKSSDISKRAQVHTSEIARTCTVPEAERIKLENEYGSWS